MLLTARCALILNAVPRAMTLLLTIWFRLYSNETIEDPESVMQFPRQLFEGVEFSSSGYEPLISEHGPVNNC